MSIIYDALKKAEASKEAASRKDKEKNTHKLRNILLFVLVVCIGFFIARSLFSLFVNPIKIQVDVETEKSSGHKSVPAPAATQSAPSPSVPQEETHDGQKPIPTFNLSGIFYSEGQSFALINNKIVKEGDDIAGAKVLRITAEEVDLQFEDSVVRLYSQGR